MSASSERGSKRQRQLGDLMTELGLISEEQLATVLETQKESKKPLGQIIVELGFASGAAVAHALAMQAGGSLRTEYGFALGVNAGEGDSEQDEARAGIPKLRLAATAAAPPAPAPIEPFEASERHEPVDEVSAVPEVEDPVDEAPAAEPLTLVPEVEEPIVVEHDAVELEQLRSEVERLEAALAEAQGATFAEHELLEGRHEQATAELERLQTTLAETQASHEQEVARLHEEHEHVVAEVERLRTALPETEAAAVAEHERLRAELATLEASRLQTETAHEQELTQLRDRHEQATAEVERLQATLADTDTTREQELARLQAEHEQATAELERAQTTLAETQTTHEHELAELREEHEHATAEVERLQATLAGGDTTREQELARLQAEHEQATAELEHAQTTLAEAQTTHEQELAELREEHEQATAEVDRLRAALPETEAAAVAEQERLRTELAKLENTRAETEAVHEQELTQLREQHEQATAEVKRLQAGLDEVRIAAGEQARRDAEEQTRLLADEQDRRQDERESLVAERKAVEEKLDDALEQLAAATILADERGSELQHAAGQLRDALQDAPAAAATGARRLAGVKRRLKRGSAGEAENETDQPQLADVLTAHAQELTRLRDEHGQATAEVERLHATLADAETTHQQQLTQLQEKHEQATAELDRLRTAVPESEATAVAEQDRLRAELAELENARTEAEAAHEQELAQLREQHDRATAEVEGLHATLAEAQTAAAEHARRLAEQHETHAGERDELVAQRDRLQADLEAALEQLAGFDPAAEEASATELRRLGEERDGAIAELAEAKEMLQRAEQVREAQIALAEERDRAVAELERLEAVAAEAQAAVEEQTRLLASEQDRSADERESLIAERKIVEEKLDDALERLAAAVSLADERGRQLQRAADRLHDAIEEEPADAGTGTKRLAGVGRRLAAKLASPDDAEPEGEQLEYETETEAVEPDLKHGGVSADNPTESTNWRSVMDEFFESETVFDEQFVEPGNEGSAAVETARTWDLIDDEALGAPVWGRSLERVLGLFDSEATRLQELRGKMQGLGREMAAREARVKELETELQRSHIERLRDQETVDRLKHELAERNNRLERALANTQELAAIIQGAQVR